MEQKKKLPIGIDDFVKLREDNFYFVDKSGFIKDLLNNWAEVEVNLFTRPRRFGKSLNMSMLKAFFELHGDKTIFEGLEITKEEQLCEEYMGAFPVIFLTLKGVEGRTYEEAVLSLKSVIGFEARNFLFLEESDKLSIGEKKDYQTLIESENGIYTMSEETLKRSLLLLSSMLQKHYGRKVIVLIDEYDVPLDKANQFGYYEEMIGLIRSLFHSTLKTNPYLKFAVLTGCLRIAKESIFTGMNNFRVYSITNIGFDQYFGFTDTEIKEMLEYYQISDVYENVKNWYDGYLFGKEKIYCPWDVLNYCGDLFFYQKEYPGKILKPENYWINTSGNYIVRTLISNAQGKTKKELEILVGGGTLEKEIEENLTYKDLDQNMVHLWSVLLATGYLTCTGITEEGLYQLRIPNLEIRSIFAAQIMKWFQEQVKADPSSLDALCLAVEDGKAEEVEKRLTAYLKKTISIRDTFVSKPRKENFYHGILLGLLSHREDWVIRSNAETGDGYSDILIHDEESDIGIILELKYAEQGKLEEYAQNALWQIEKENYAEELYDDGVTTVIKYGISFYKKRCKVMIEK